MSRSRNAATDLVRLLNQCAAPVYLLDDQRRIVFCNEACQQWTGLKAEELIGQQCSYHTPANNDASSRPPTDITAAMCPPPQVFSGQAQTAVVCRALPDGQVTRRRGHFWPLGEGHDDSAAVIAVLEACDCDSEPQQADELERSLHEQVRRFRQQRARRYDLDSLIGASPSMVRARAQVELAVASSAWVLIQGPLGAGKDHVAKAIHYGRGERGPLVLLDCAVLEPNLMRSTLRALALRSADSQTPGTLLLGDVDCLLPEAQADLLELASADRWRMRLVGTATRALNALVDEGRFSHSLACRLGTLVIELPPLARRAEDLALLAQTLLEEVNAQGGKQVAGFTADAFDQLAAYGWPGNLDELAAVVRHAHDQASGGEISRNDLPRQIHLAASASVHPPRVEEPIVLEEFLAKVERELIERALRRARGNKSKAARLLGMTRPRLYRRLVQLGLEKPED